MFSQYQKWKRDISFQNDAQIVMRAITNIFCIINISITYQLMRLFACASLEIVKKSKFWCSPRAQAKTGTCSRVLLVTILSIRLAQQSSWKFQIHGPPTLALTVVRDGCLPASSGHITNVHLVTESPCKRGTSGFVSLLLLLLAAQTWVSEPTRDCCHPKSCVRRNLPSALAEEPKIWVSSRISPLPRLPTRWKPSSEDDCLENLVFIFFQEKQEEALRGWRRKKVVTAGALEQITPILVSRILSQSARAPQVFRVTTYIAMATSPKA